MDDDGFNQHYVGGGGIMSQALKFDLSRLPAQGRSDRGSRIGGLFMMVFAAFWGGMPTLMVISSLQSGEFEPSMLFALIFTVIGTGIFLGGLWLLTRQERTIIHADHVEQTVRSIFGRREWSEPLTAFPGVVYRSEYHSGGKNSSSYTLYIVELHHEDKKKRIKLYSSRSDSGVRGIWEDCCRYLELPALEDNGGVMQARASEDLDKSVRELAAEGKLEVAFDPAAPPPAGIGLKLDGSKLRVEVEASAMPIWAALIAVGLPGIFIYLGFWGDAPIFFGVIGVIFMAIFGAATIWNIFTREVIELDRESIRIFRTSRRGDSAGKMVNPESVESVTVRGDGNGQQKTVRIQTDAETHKIGAGLKEDALVWLRDCVLAVITR